MQTQAPLTPRDLVGDLVEHATGWRDLLEQLKAGHATSSEVELAFMLFQRKASPLAK